MLRITASESSEAIKQYFRDVLSKGDYYLKGQKIPALCAGLGAEKLGITGPISQKVFDRLADNLKPDGSQLTAYTIENRRPCYDFTFDVSKSVSILSAITGDARIQKTMQTAARAMMKEMELEMHARVRVGDANDDRQTGNMIYVEVPHKTTRPAPAMNGLPEGTPDMHEHIHFIVFNATYDAVEDKWKAGEFSRIKRDGPYWQARYHARVAAELQKLGYDITPTAKAFELTGISRELIEKFSRRKAQIEIKAAELGITDPDRKSKVGKKTASKKVDTPDDLLRRFWREHLTPDEYKQVKAVYEATRHNPHKAKNCPEAAKRSLNYALKHELYRASEVSERRLIATALKHGIGQCHEDTVRQAMSERSDLLTAQIGEETHVTTHAVLEEEMRLLNLIREGRGQVPPLVAGKYQYKAPLFLDPTKDTREQKEAIKLVMHSQDWVIGIAGVAGSGKSTLLHEIDAGMKENRRSLVICAPSTDASRGSLRKEGFESAETVKKVLTDPQIQKQLRGGVLWVDEAGMLGNEDMLELLELAKKQGTAKVVLAGDKNQIRSVTRGDSFRHLEENCGLKVAYLTRNQRQKNPELKAAVDAIRKKDLVHGFEKLDEHNGLKEMWGASRHQALAQDYLNKTAERIGKNKYKTALVVSATHKECEDVSLFIREGLKNRGQIKGKEETVERHLNLHLSEADRAEAVNYEPGLLVQFKQNIGEFRKSEQLHISEVNTKAGWVNAQRADGSLTPLPLAQSEHFDVYAPKEIKMAQGDCIRLTSNGYATDRKYKLRNGSFHTISGFTSKGEIMLANGKILPENFKHFNHGYAVTADSAQSKTVHAVYAAIGEDSLSATDLRRFYVMLSRAREEGRVYTEDKDALMRAVRRDDVRRTATEVIRDGRISEETRVAVDQTYKYELESIRQERARYQQQERIRQQKQRYQGREMEL